MDKDGEGGEEDEEAAKRARQEAPTEEADEEADVATEEAQKDEQDETEATDEKDAQDEKVESKAESSSRHSFAAGDRVRLKGLQADVTMNGLLGYLISHDETDGRWLVRLDGNLGDVRVRESNIDPMSEHVSSTRSRPSGPPVSRKSDRAAALSAKSAIEAAQEQEHLHEHASDKRKQAAKPPASKAVTARAKATGNKRKYAHSAMHASCTFNMLDYRICSEPALQVWDSGKECWRPCHLYQSLVDSRIVIWYGADEYEGLPPSKPYKFSKVSKNAVGYPVFTGRAPGELLDGDGESVPTRVKTSSNSRS
eukprot:TRINITY_DN42047_c0_g1_i1.p1 TRINITY_DN42047_c0_g1~~TRINITY_DN42047_c0_g1_i1.p1  ORF type:complete len:310 (+),score=76.98 TRINITY_DN42047_c0_g1_i1:91-1020(+)